MKFSVLPILLFICMVSAQAQEMEQPAAPYPFNAALYTPDSVKLNSGELLKKGKPTVLAFWLTTCVPCMGEFATYTQKYPDWKKQADFDLYGISIDFPYNFHKIKTLSKEKGWPFPVYWDRERYFRATLPGGLNGLPQVFVFDKNGRLAWHHKGFYPGLEEELWAKIKELN